MEKKRFKNIPTKRFYEFFQEKINNRELTHKEIAEKFNVYPTNPSGFLYELTQGKISVKLEYILLAEEYFGLKPIDLFIQENFKQGLDDFNKFITKDDFDDAIEIMKSEIINEIRNPTNDHASSKREKKKKTGS